MIANAFQSVSRLLRRLRYPANPKVTFPLNQNTASITPLNRP